jgi:glycosyltransferase involved in cell wall biosynthesis
LPEEAFVCIRDRVRFVGDQPHTTIGRWYAAADIFTLPSPSETRVLVLIEAMMAGLPCVAIDRGGPCEIVQQGRTGWRVPLNAESFACAISNLLCSSQTHARFATMARERASVFSADAMANGVLDVYASAQARNRQHAR